MQSETREKIINKAKAEFIDTGLTRNITEALRLYQEKHVPPDEWLPLWITAPEIDEIQKLLEKVRPTCSQCGGKLFLIQSIAEINGVKYPTSWTCKDCLIMYYSVKSTAQWIKELQVEIREKDLQHGDEPVTDALPTGRQDT